MNDSLEYIIGDEARRSGIDGVTNVFGFKQRIGSSDAEYSRENQYFIAPKGDTARSRTLSVKQATETYLKVLLEKFDDVPDSWIVGQPSITDEIWLKNFRKHVRDAFLVNGYDSVEFWPEPFAVFQYYCNSIDNFKKPTGEELILVIDVGGGTFNSSIIHTTESGDLGRGGAKRVPYGLQSDFVGGHIIDEKLLDLIIEKAKGTGIRFKDPNIRERVRRLAPQVLLGIEEMKISLSRYTEQPGYNKHHEEKIEFAAGTIHDERPISVSISCTELENIVTHTWNNQWFPIIDKTVNDASKNHSVVIRKLDRVLIAGGSSQLPNMKFEAFKCLSTKISMDQVYLGANSESAVATGIALECLERSARDPGLTVSHLANCMTNELYFGIRQTRKDGYEKLLVKRDGEKNRDGQILSASMDSIDLHLNYRITSPFDIGEKLLFAFSKEPIEGNCPLTLNPAPCDIVSIPVPKRSIKREFNLDLTIRKDGQISPTFIFHTKSRDNPHIEVKAPDFYFDDLNIRDGASYIGVDFGNSNSYITKYVSVENQFSISEYPKFDVSKKTKRRLLGLEKQIVALRALGRLSSAASLASLEDKKLAIIYNSNKIEGNKLSFGETTSVIAGEAVVVDENSKTEVLNLERAYSFVSENYASLFDSPISFIRQVHSIISDGLLKSSGKFRSVSVEIFGVDYIPPQAPLVPPLMDDLCSEIRTRGHGRSPIEFVASIHTAFTMIHPFEDGNGRTARAIIAALLIDFGLPQVVLKIDDRSRYMSTLGVSNKGDISGVVNLVCDIIESELSLLYREKNEPKELDVVPTSEEAPALDFAGLSSLLERAEKPLLDFSSFKKVIEAKESEVKIESQYKLWAASVNRFSVAFHEVCDDVNQMFEEKALQIDVKSFDSISYEAYLAFQGGEPLVATWFFQVEVSWIKNVSILFTFISKPSDIPSADGNICLLISTPEQIQEGLQPISGTLHKYVYVKDQKVLFYPESANLSDSLEQNILEFLTEAISTFGAT